MKFVYNEEKNKEVRRILMMQPTVEEAESLLKKDDTDAYNWYVYGTALGLRKEYPESIEAYSHGIACNPFYAPNYFGRGRKHNVSGHYWAAIADFTMCIQLDYSNWTYWYYRATTENLSGDLANSIQDFEECFKYTDPREQYPLVHWHYTTYAEMGDAHWSVLMVRLNPLRWTMATVVRFVCTKELSNRRNSSTFHCFKNQSFRVVPAGLNWNATPCITDSFGIGQSMAIRRKRNRRSSTCRQSNMTGRSVIRNRFPMRRNWGF